MEERDNDLSLDSILSAKHTPRQEDTVELKPLRQILDEPTPPSPDKKAKKKKSKGLAVLIVIALLLIGTGVGLLAKVYLENKALAQQASDDVEKFEEQVAEVTPAPTDAPVVADTESVPSGALGVLYIPSFNNFKHTIAYGVDYNTLNWYVGMYKTYSQIGEPGNCILAAHSNVLPGDQPYSYFNRIEDYVKVGDEVNVLWHDGNTYHYQVIQISTNVPKENEDSIFEYAPDNRQYLILQTCTYGNGKVRTLIRCERTDDYEGAVKIDG